MRDDEFGRRSEPLVFPCLKHGIVVTTLANIITNWNETSISSP
jgi:hypothetical protein